MVGVYKFESMLSNTYCTSQRTVWGDISRAHVFSQAEGK